MQFEVFYKILLRLGEIDVGLMDRLGINDPDNFSKKRKLLTKPFGTKDESLREVKVYEKVKVVPRQNIYTSRRVKDSLVRSISRSRSRNGLEVSQVEKQYIQ